MTKPVRTVQPENVPFRCPTNPDGTFAQRMSRISGDPTAASQGSVLNSNDISKKLFDQLQMALTVQLGLNGPQQIKERALQNVLTSKSARGDLKQILQSRAEIYVDDLDPK